MSSNQVTGIISVAVAVTALLTIYNFIELRKRSKEETTSKDLKQSINPTSSSKSLSELNNESILSAEDRYRMDAETLKSSSASITNRGKIWVKHASWQLPNVPRSTLTTEAVTNRYGNFTNVGLNRIQSILRKYSIDPIHGFLPSQEPIHRLTCTRYQIWEDLADDIPKLLGARLGQVRTPLEKLPILSIDQLPTHEELRRAHLLLCLFAHAYIWGGHTPMNRLPSGIAVPLWEVSQALEIPPVLGHPSIVLYNWRKLDNKGAICMENLATLNNFFDGRDESWFYLITVEIEARGAQGIIPMMLALDAIERYQEEQRLQRELSAPINNMNSNITMSGSANTYPNMIHYITKDREEFPTTNTTTTVEQSISILTIEEGEKEEDHGGMEEAKGKVEKEEIIYINAALIGELDTWRVITYVTAQLKHVALAIRGMVASMKAMREGCHPFIFYHRVRPFLSGWKHNPTMPQGIIYEGVSTEPQQYYGGSAAQSTLIPFFDITLGITHDSEKSRDFLLAMRDYMVKEHRSFLTFLEQKVFLRSFVEEQISLVTNNTMALHSMQELCILSLRDAYDECINGLKDFRTAHLNVVAEYIIAQ
jgi:hypothetical protein